MASFFGLDGFSGGFWPGVAGPQSTGVWEGLYTIHILLRGPSLQGCSAKMHEFARFGLFFLIPICRVDTSHGIDRKKRQKVCVLVNLWRVCNFGAPISSVFTSWPRCEKTSKNSTFYEVGQFLACCGLVLCLFSEEFCRTSRPCIELHCYA